MVVWEPWDGSGAREGAIAGGAGIGKSGAGNRQLCATNRRYFNKLHFHLTFFKKPWLSYFILFFSTLKVVSLK